MDLLRPLRSLLRDPAAGTVGLVFAINSVLFGGWVARLPEIKSGLGLSEAALGLALIGMPIGSILIMPVVGYLVARRGAGRTTLWTTLALCAAVVSPGFAVGFWSFASALVLLGLCSGAMNIAMNAEASAVERRAPAPIWAACHGCFSLGGMVGAATGALAASLGIPLRVHLLAAGVSMAAVVLARRRTLLDGSGPAPAAVAARPRLALPAGPLVGLAVLAAMVLVGEGAMADWTAVYLHGTVGAGVGVAGLGYAAYSLAMALGRFFGDELTVRFDPARVVCVGAGAAAVGLGAALLLHHPAAALVGFVCVGLGYANVIPVLYRAAARASGAAEGVGIAAVASVGYLGFLAGPPVIGLAAEVVGLAAALGIVVLLAAIVAAAAPRVLGREVPGARAAAAPSARAGPG